jgi:predicted TIM-barrel fold metal-dependent hydrolase
LWTRTRCDFRICRSPRAIRFFQVRAARIEKPGSDMRVDIHAHYMDRGYLELLASLGDIEPGLAAGQQILFPGLEADLDARFRVMSNARVDRQILSVSGLMPYFNDAASGVRGARYINDLYAELVRAQPARLSAFAALPLPHIDESLAEIARALDELGMVGVTLATSVLGMSLGDATFDSIYAELDRRGAVLFIHPAGLACGSEPIKAAGLLWPLGGTAEDTLCAISLMTSGFTTRFPNIRCILPHLGGTLPLLMHRLDRPLRAKLPDQQPLEAVARAFWYDTVNGYIPALHCACTAFGADRLVFGSDYPFFRDDAYTWQAAYIEQSGLPDAEIRAMFDDNVRRLFAGTALPLGHG